MEENYSEPKLVWDQDTGSIEKSSVLSVSKTPGTIPRHPASPWKENSKGPCKHRKGGRLWQLPQSSIQEYAKWIEMKPEDTQTHGERRFLNRYHRKQWMERQKLPHESTKLYVARLETKAQLSQEEQRLIETYHRRKAHRRRRRQDDNPFRGSIIPPSVFWTRENSSLKKSPLPSSFPPQSQQNSTGISVNMSSLQERMKHMGLTSDKLLDIPMNENGKFPFQAT